MRRPGQSLRLGVAADGLALLRVSGLLAPAAEVMAVQPVESGAPDALELASVHLERAEVADYVFMRGKGCGDCRGTGYRGRRSIAEILTLNDEIRELIVDKQPIRRIKAAAHANGTRSLRLAALDLVRRGATTIDEIKRVTLHA